MSSPSPRDVDKAVAVLKEFLQHLETEFDPAFKRSPGNTPIDPDIKRLRDSFFNQFNSAEETLGGLRKWADILRQNQIVNRSHGIRH